jgi:uncharacterized damage-inducible protein DinB
MKVRWLHNALMSTLLSLVVAQASAQVPAGVGEGWLGEFDHATRQLLQLAEATPAEKFSWRPAPGVRSISEVYMHLALGNYFLLRQAGVTPPIDLAALGKEPEKSKTVKADVIAFLKSSADFMRGSYPTLDRQKTVKVFGKEITVDNLLLRVLVHNHEHMGQSIAYARMNGVAPPWSKGSSQ